MKKIKGVDLYVAGRWLVHLVDGIIIDSYITKDLGGMRVEHENKIYELKKKKKKN
jgi:hypothetical protein